MNTALVEMTILAVRLLTRLGLKLTSPHDGPNILHGTVSQRNCCFGRLSATLLFSESPWRGVAKFITEAQRGFGHNQIGGRTKEVTKIRMPNTVSSTLCATSASSAPLRWWFLLSVIQF